MDTDNLTPMAYETISRAGDILDVLRNEIGASASGKKTEDDFLRGVRSHLRAIMRSTSRYLDDWNYAETMNVRDFRQGVRALLAHVETTIATPIAQRGKWESEYLAFIHQYTTLHGTPPAEADMQAFFRVSPPTVHQMVLTLESKGFIERTPGQARSIKVRLPAENLPRLTR